MDMNVSGISNLYPPHHITRFGLSNKPHHPNVGEFIVVNRIFSTDATTGESSVHAELVRAPKGNKPVDLFALQKKKTVGYVEITPGAEHTRRHVYLSVPNGSPKARQHEYYGRTGERDVATATEELNEGQTVRVDFKRMLLVKPR